MTPPNQRSAYGASLVRLGRKDGRVVALEADLGKSTQSVMFQAEFPDRYFQMGIAEQNMASTAAGFALAGMIPFMHSFAVFAAGRDYDQLRNSICVPNLPVRICGSSAGLSDFGDGKTHQGIEDAALMRALPNMTVLCPADAIEIEKMMDCLLDWKGPVYIRINRNDLPFVYPPEEPYSIGKVTMLREGSHAAIFASGVMVSKALRGCGGPRVGGNLGEGARRQHSQAPGPRRGDPLCGRSGGHRYGRGTLRDWRARLCRGGGAAGGRSRACGVCGYARQLWHIGEEL